MIKAILIFLLTLIVGAIISGAAPINPHQVAHFPGDKELPDPTGRWSIVWQEATPSQPHALLLMNFKTGNITNLLWFNRYATVMWAPDGNALAITDHEGSSDSIIWVARPEVSADLINVEKVFIKDLGRISEIYENGHRYFEALNWVGPRTLRFKVEAYDAYPGKQYKATFRYEIGGKVSKECKEKE